MLQSELGELPKQMSLPGSMPTSPAASLPRTCSSCWDTGFSNLIVSGWKERRTKESVEVELGEKLAASEVQVKALILYGRRPAMGRIELDLPAGPALPTKRALQIGARGPSLKPRGGSTSTNLPDFGPCVRVLVACLVSFGRLALPKTQLVVSSWKSGRAFLGDCRISGLYEGEGADRAADHLPFVNDEPQ